MSPLSSLWPLLVATFVVLVTNMALAGSETKKNFVLVYVDDLRPDLKAAYGRQGVSTPNFDDFAQRRASIVLQKAYTNYPMCGPSRTSTLFGRLPISTGILSNLDDAETKHAVYENLNPSLPKYLQSQGYYTATGGKVFHEAGINGDNCWNLTYDATTTQTTKTCKRDRFAVRPLLPGTRFVLSPQICITNLPLNSIQDIRLANRAVRTLDRIIANNHFPFFLSVGFYKPHAPLHIQRTFWRTGPRSVPPPERIYPPEPANSFIHNLTFSESPNWAWATNPRVVDLSKYGPRQTYFRQFARRAYAAAVLQTDYAFGIVWKGLESRGLLNNTMVLMIADHGYGMGENNLWAKNALFETMLRVPAMLYVPWAIPGSSTQLAPVNRISMTFVELVDFYRTTSSLLGVGGNVPAVVDGIDHSQLFYSTIQSGNETTPGVNPGSAVSMIARCSNFDRCDQSTTLLVTAIGFSIRTNDFRYNVYLRASANRAVDWDNSSSVIAHELFDHSKDSRTFLNHANMSYLGEYQNIAPENPATCALLYQKLRTEFLGRRSPLARGSP